jgi:hypothetical protein
MLGGPYTSTSERDTASLFCLAGKGLGAMGGLKEAMTEDERYAVADHVVSQLKEHGEPVEPVRGGATKRRVDHLLKTAR